MDLKSPVKHVLRIFGHALVKSVHERLDVFEQRDDDLRLRIADLAQSQGALLQAAIHVAESLQLVQRESRELKWLLGRQYRLLEHLQARIGGYEKSCRAQEETVPGLNSVSTEEIASRQSGPAGGHPPPPSRPEEVLAPLPEPFRSRLLSMYAGELQLGSAGALHALDSCTRISPEQGMWLYRLCCELKPKRTIEIGLGYGFSTLYFLAAIRENGEGFHVAIDPHQQDWHGIGLRQAESVAMAHAFRCLNQKSFPALVELAREHDEFELIFIDGNHRFDDVLVDFVLSAELCPLGGCIVLDDLWLPSVQRVVSFVRSNRLDFKEVETEIPSIAAFRRIADDTREWHYHADF